MTQSKADPCVWYLMKDENIWLLTAVYVDDILYAGSVEARKWFKENIKSRFNIADLGHISKHLGVWYRKKKDRKGTIGYELSMPDYQKELVSDYEKARALAKKATTPGYPGDSLVRNKESPVDDIENFRKILGKAMWFCRKIMPECGNAIRELASNMDHPTNETWKALGRLVGYVKSNPNATLFLKKPKDLKAYAFVDSNWATNKENRKSVTGYVLTIGGCLVNWVSKSQPSVTLSSTEAEYVAASMCATDIMFVQMLMEEVVPYMETRPATLFEDNTGCIFLLENKAVGSRTKHIDIKMHHIREMMQGNSPRLVVKFTRSESNYADPMTKNVTDGIFHTLVPALKDGGISEAIYHTVNREDVGKYSGGAARTAARTENQARGYVRSAAVFPVLTVVRNGRDSTHELTTIAHFPIEDSGSAPEEITQQERSKIPG